MYTTVVYTDGEMLRKQKKLCLLYFQSSGICSFSKLNMSFFPQF